MVQRFEFKTHYFDFVSGTQATRGDHYREWDTHTIKEGVHVFVHKSNNVHEFKNNFKQSKFFQLILVIAQTSLKSELPVWKKYMQHM